MKVQNPLNSSWCSCWWLLIKMRLEKSSALMNRFITVQCGHPYQIFNYFWIQFARELSFVEYVWPQWHIHENITQIRVSITLIRVGTTQIRVFNWKIGNCFFFNFVYVFCGFAAKRRGEYFLCHGKKFPFDIKYTLI